MPRACAPDPVAAETLAALLGWPLAVAPHTTEDLTGVLDSLAFLAETPDTSVCTSSPELLRHVRAQQLFNDSKLTPGEWQAFRDWHALVGWQPAVVVAPHESSHLLDTLLKWTSAPVVATPADAALLLARGSGGLLRPDHPE